MFTNQTHMPAPLIVKKDERPRTFDEAVEILRRTKDIRQAFLSMAAFSKETYHRLHRAMLEMNPPRLRPNLKVFVFWGRSWVGKTHYVRSVCPRDESLTLGSVVYGRVPIMGIPTQTHAVFDWVGDGRITQRIDALLELTDKNKPVEVRAKHWFYKYGWKTCAFNADTIWLVSLWPPERWFPSASKAKRDELMSRFTEVFYYKNSRDNHLPPDFQINPMYVARYQTEDDMLPDTDA